MNVKSVFGKLLFTAISQLINEPVWIYDPPQIIEIYRIYHRDIFL